MGAASVGASVGASYLANDYTTNYGKHDPISDTNSNPVEDHEYVLSTEGMRQSINKERNNYSDLTTTINIGTSFANILKSNINKYDFLKGTYGVSNAIDFNEGISAGTFSLYDKGYKEALGQISFLNRTSKIISKGGYYVGYYDGVDKALHGDIVGGGVSAGSNYTAEYIATEFGWGYGLAFSLTWTYMDKYVSQTEWYNRLLFGKESDVYIERGLKNGWYFDNWKE